MSNRIIGSLAAFALIFSFVAARPATTRAGLDDIPAEEVANLCQYLQEHGYFEGEYLQGFTIDQCVTYFMTPGSEQAQSFVLGLCGLDVVRSDFGFESQGDCVSRLTIPG